MKLRRKLVAAICCVGVLALVAAKAMHLGHLIFPDPFSPNSVPYQADVQQQSRRSQQISEAVVFFGDSITVGLATSNVASKSENFGINGDTIDGLLLRVPHYKLDGARMIVVAIGVNNWEKDRLAKFGEKYEKLLQLFPQSVPVIVSAILPVNTHSKAYPMLANARPAILGANRDIALVCGRHAKCQFVDISSKLTMPSGDLAPRYDVGDGVHISSDAYQVWTQALSTLISSAPSKD